MTDHRRVLMLMALLAVVSIGVAGVLVSTLYSTAISEGRDRLAATARSQARLIEAVARYDQRHLEESGAHRHESVPEDAVKATLSQILSAHEGSTVLGETGEFTLAKRVDDQIVFLMRRHDDAAPDAVPLNGQLAEPTRRALAGQSGTLIGLDYRGDTVLAAYEPVAELDLGIVAKIDLSEVREPFLRAGALGSLVALALILLGSFVIQRLANPLVEHLEQSERKYRTLFESSTEAVFLYSDHVEDCNDQTCALLGRERAEIVGRKFVDFLPETLPDGSERASFVDEKLAAILAGTQLNLVAPALRKDGTLIDVEVNAKSIEVGGRQGLILLTARDVTARKRVEEHLGLLATAVEHAAESVVVTDSTGKIEYVNPAFERVTGYSSEEAVGRNPRFLSSGRHPLAFYEELWATIGRGEVWEGRFTNKSKDGSFSEVEGSISPVRDAEGRILRYVAVRRDVTATVELERQLFQSQKMEAIGRLAGGIAHDFNNILSPILGYAELALEDAVQEDRKPLEHIVQSAERATALVGEMLAFSRAGKSRLEPTELCRCLREPLDLLRAILPATIEVEERLDASCPRVQADRTQIYQAVLNLGTNAQHAMRNRRGVLGVRLEEVELDAALTRAHADLWEGPAVRLTVSDTGCGMGPETLERAFEPFFTTKDVDEGSGLGLAVVHGIVSNHDAVLTIESEPDHGTTVCVYFHPVEVLTPQGPRALEPPGRTRGHVLLVDSEEESAHVARQMFERLGYGVTVRTDPVQALRDFREQPERFDVVVTDQTMPQTSGVELARELRCIRSDLPILLATGYSEDLTVEYCRERDLHGPLTKPFGKDELGRALRRALGRERKVEA